MGDKIQREIKGRNGGDHADRKTAREAEVILARRQSIHVEEVSVLAARLLRGNLESHHRT